MADTWFLRLTAGLTTATVTVQHAQAGHWVGVRNWDRGMSLDRCKVTGASRYVAFDNRDVGTWVKETHHLYVHGVFPSSNLSISTTAAGLVLMVRVQGARALLKDLSFGTTRHCMCLLGRPATSGQHLEHHWCEVHIEHARVVICLCLIVAQHTCVTTH